MQNVSLNSQIILTIAADPKMTINLLPLLLLLLSVTALAQTAQTELPRINMQAGMYQINAQVASTPEQRAIGLMNRPDMPQHEGMLFVFENPQVQCFWMKNTLMPLTAAFIADDGSIVNLADMKPQTTDSHCSDKPVRYVLEMKQGWFASKQIKKSYVLKSSLFKPAAVKSDPRP
jgi:uncharacterized membrane protein (UPF0127 family)